MGLKLRCGISITANIDITRCCCCIRIGISVSFTNIIKQKIKLNTMTSPKDIREKSGIRIEGVQIILSVKDMNVSRAFYRDILGFEEVEWEMMFLQA
jgi:hypothetical protein